MNPITFRLARPVDFADISTDDATAEVQDASKAGGPKTSAKSSAKDEGGKEVKKDAAFGPDRIWGSKTNPGIICLVFSTTLEYCGQKWEFMLKKMKRADKQDEQDWNIYPHATKDTVNVKMQPSGAGPHQIISALRRVGLVLRMCYSPKRDFIYVFVTATESRIQKMAADLELLRPLNPREAVKLCRVQSEKFPLAENTRLDFFSLKSEQNDPLRKKWERPWDAPGDFVINKSLENPISLSDYPEEAKFGGDKDDAELRDMNTANHKCSFVSMDAWKNVWIRYRTDLKSKIWQKSNDGSIFTVQDKLVLIYKIMTSDKKVGGAEIKMGSFQTNEGNPLVEVFALHDDTKVNEVFKPKSIFKWFWTGTMGSSLEWECALYNIWCYYGEEIAWYFSFLQNFGHWLIIPCLVEIWPMIWKYGVGQALPLGAELFFIPMVYMSAVLAPRWEYRKSVLFKQWGINASSKIYQETFRGIYDVDIDSGKIQLLRDPAEDQKAVQSYYNKITSVFSLIIVGMYTVIQVIKLYTSQSDNELLNMLSGGCSGLNAACIIIFGGIYNAIVDKAVISENYRWRSEHENRLVSYASPFLAINNFGVVVMLCHVFPWTPIFTHYPEDVVEKGELVMTSVGMFITTTLGTLLVMKVAKEYILPGQMKKILIKAKEANQGAPKDHSVWDIAKAQPPPDKQKDKDGNIIRAYSEITKMGLLMYEDRRDVEVQAAWKLPNGFVTKDDQPVMAENPMIILQESAEEGMLKPQLPPIAKKIEAVIVLVGYVSLFFIICPAATQLSMLSVIAALYVDAKVTCPESRRKLPRSVDEGIGEYRKALEAFPIIGVVNNWFMICILSDRLHTILDWTMPDLNVMPVRIGIAIVCVFPILYVFSQVISSTKNEYEPVLAKKAEIGQSIETFVRTACTKSSGDEKEGKKD